MKVPLASAVAVLTFLAGGVVHAQTATVGTAGEISGAEPPHEYTDESELEQEVKSNWDPKSVFPGNYWALPLTVSVSFRPCLDCSGIPWTTPILSRPGDASFWLGYAFQPIARSSSPFAAAGVDWVFYDKDAEKKSHWRQTVTPTLRAGWNFTGISVWASGGVILPGEDRDRAGFHAGVGASSFALIALSVCAGAAVPSTIEVGYDALPRDPVTGADRNRTTFKFGWGF